MSAVLAGTAFAQPAERDHRGPAERRVPPPPGNAAGPTEAPPSPREEHQAAKAGFVWIGGKWEWKGKWEWTPGHWERERAGKQWRPGHWDKNGSAWIWTEGVWIDAGAAVPPPPVPPNGNTGVVPPVLDHRPHQAPPPPRAENQGPAKAGFVWVAGSWDWKGDKWDWVPGHWERERAGKKWRPREWHEESGTWVLVDGDWIDVNATIPPPPPPGGNPPPPPPPMGNNFPPPHEWHHIERPTVSSYWPPKGKAGSRVVVRGENFANDTRVFYGPDEVRAAKVGPDRIQFEIPANAASATIILKGGGRDLIVGNFEVANYDAEAEARRIEAERQAAAQAAWAKQQAAYAAAKDAAARQAAMEQHWQELAANREQRREQRLEEIRAKWQAAFLADADTQAELQLHAERVADLTRAKDVATVTNNQKLGIRIDVALAKENDRHEQRMSSLQAAFSTRGGHP
ncbi:MAG: IPT/TIG domain-containing protein [Kofleriaceae bacterium]